MATVFVSLTGTSVRLSPLAKAAERRQERARRARKQKTYRQRLARGIVVFRIPADFNGIANALIRMERISEEDALDRAKVEAALVRAVADLAREWEW